MPRQIEETLINVQFAVRQMQTQEVDPKDGKPVFNGKGEPKTQPQWVVDFFDAAPHEVRVIHVPLSEDGKNALIAGLTGIQVASAISNYPVI